MSKSPAFQFYPDDELSDSNRRGYLKGRHEGWREGMQHASRYLEGLVEKFYEDSVPKEIEAIIVALRIVSTTTKRAEYEEDTDE